MEVIIGVTLGYSLAIALVIIVTVTREVVAELVQRIWPRPEPSWATGSEHIKSMKEAIRATYPNINNPARCPEDG